MRVVQVVDTIASSVGGTARVTLDLAIAIDRIEGVSCCIVTQQRSDPECSGAENIAVHRVASTKRQWDRKNVWAELSRLHRSEPIDLIHINGIWDPFLHFASTFSRSEKIPYVIAPHGMLEPWSLSQKRLKKKIAWQLYQRRDLQNAAAIQVTAQSELQSIQRLCSLNAFVVPNGLNIPEVPDHSRRGKKVLFLSRIHPKKGIPLLLNAWDKVRPEGWTLHIVGPGEQAYVQSIKASIKELNLISCVEVYPEANDTEKRRFYEEASLFVLPSYSENFGLVVAEAMAMELPVITTDTTPWTNLPQVGCGWCIPLNQENLTRCLKQATDTPLDELERKGRQGRIFVTQNFAWEQVAHQMVGMYHKILNIAQQSVAG